MMLYYISDTSVGNRRQGIVGHDSCDIPVCPVFNIDAVRMHDYFSLIPSIHQG